jgi:hypothetical protein
MADRSYLFDIGAEPAPSVTMGWGGPPIAPPAASPEAKPWFDMLEMGRAGDALPGEMYEQFVHPFLLPGEVASGKYAMRGTGGNGMITEGDVWRAQQGEEEYNKLAHLLSYKLMGIGTSFAPEAAAGALGGRLVPGERSGNIVKLVPREGSPLSVDDLPLRRGGAPVIPFPQFPELVLSSPEERAAFLSASPEMRAAFEEGQKRYLADIGSPEQHAAARAAFEEKIDDWRRKQAWSSAMTVGAGGAGFLYKFWPHADLAAREPDPAEASQMRSYLQNVFPP